MILTDYLRSQKDITWDYAKQCGVEHAVIRLPETEAFDITNKSHWNTIYDRFINFGIKPVIIEPMPNDLHDHIKLGDEKRDESIEKVLRMFDIMNELDIRQVCFNFMAYVGWTRTTYSIKERGNALVTGFDLADYVPGNECITEEQLWNNYTYFIKAVIDKAEKCNITLALHPDDPPIAKLGNVSRILINAQAMNKALHVVESTNLGLTMCQATFSMMGEDLYKIIPQFADKIKFVHFRNVTGEKKKFRETFHDNGDLEMGKLLRLYYECGINVPIRVDHVPNMAGEQVQHVGYDALGRLFAIGYLKGLMEGIANE